MVQLILKYLFALLLFSGGIFHFLRADLYDNFMPEFFPKFAANILAGITEIVIAVLIILKKTERVGAILFSILMLVFLPIHIWDFCKEEPAIGGKLIAFIRIIIQLLMIGWGYSFWKKKTSNI